MLREYFYEVVVSGKKTHRDLLFPFDISKKDESTKTPLGD